MRVPGMDLAAERLDAPLPIAHVAVQASQWSALAGAAADAGERLVALWGTAAREAHDGGSAVHAAYATSEGLLWATLRLGDALHYPDVSASFACASRMQRAIADLCDLHAAGATDSRPWLDHGTWPLAHPLRGDDASAPDSPRVLGPGDYAFVRVEGDGVHEIPVGPVHAGIIEPGHFRFSIVGEKVLRLEERLGYVHKGIEQRFTALMPLEAHRLAGRVSGDSTVAYAWAYAMALESAAGAQVPPRAQWLRAVMLERERVANHLGDLGALGNDAALAFALAQFSRLREDWQRLSQAAFGHRLMMDGVVPGGVAADIDTARVVQMHKQCDAVEAELHTLRAIFDDHSGLQDRFIGTGRVTPALARRLGLTGLAGRASGQAHDLRCDHAWPPYDRCAVAKAGSDQGDVAARVAVRFDEALSSLQIIRTLLTELPAGAVHARLLVPGGDARGAGWVEGWRGEVLVALELRDARIVRCHCHDPSWQNWPVLEHAVIGNIVPDFPLINKSFNLSYSGQDL